MAKAHNEVILIMFLSYFIKGFCQGANEETKTGAEYMQIFRNIPRLFEYFLDVLEQRVEILEKNDISTFQENIKECGNNADKREAVVNCFANGNNPSVVENDALSYKARNQYQRHKRHEALDGEYTTKIFEYGRANGPNTNLAKEETFNDIIRPPLKIMKRENSKSEFIDKPFNKRLTEMINRKVSTFKKQVKNNNIKRVKRAVPQFRKSFTGINWSQFYLSPEEVEERAIKTEQMIEDHNSQKRKK